VYVTHCSKLTNVIHLEVPSLTGTGFNEYDYDTFLQCLHFSLTVDDYDPATCNLSEFGQANRQQQLQQQQQQQQQGRMRRSAANDEEDSERNELQKNQDVTFTFEPVSDEIVPYFEAAVVKIPENRRSKSLRDILKTINEQFMKPVRTNNTVFKYPPVFIDWVHNEYQSKMDMARMIRTAFSNARLERYNVELPDQVNPYQLPTVGVDLSKILLRIIVQPSTALEWYGLGMLYQFGITSRVTPTEANPDEQLYTNKKRDLLFYGLMNEDTSKLHVDVASVPPRASTISLGEGLEVRSEVNFARKVTLPVPVPTELFYDREDVLSRIGSVCKTIATLTNLKMSVELTEGGKLQFALPELDNFRAKLQFGAILANAYQLHDVAVTSTKPVLDFDIAALHNVATPNMGGDDDAEAEEERQRKEYEQQLMEEHRKKKEQRQRAEAAARAEQERQQEEDAARAEQERQQEEDAARAEQEQIPAEEEQEEVANEEQWQRPAEEEQAAGGEEEEEQVEAEEEEQQHQQEAEEEEEQVEAEEEEEQVEAEEEGEQDDKGDAAKKLVDEVTKMRQTQEDIKQAVANLKQDVDEVRQQGETAMDEAQAARNAIAVAQAEIDDLEIDVASAKADISQVQTQYPVETEDEQNATTAAAAGAAPGTAASQPGASTAVADPAGGGGKLIVCEPQYLDALKQYVRHIGDVHACLVDTDPDGQFPGQHFFMLVPQDDKLGWKLFDSPSMSRAICIKKRDIEKMGNASIAIGLYSQKPSGKLEPLDDMPKQAHGYFYCKGSSLSAAASTSSSAAAGH